MNQSSTKVRLLLNRSRTIILILSFFLVATNLRAQVPVIASFSPQSAAAGTAVTISGTGFSNTISGNTVWFGAVRANVTAATSNLITVTAPAGAKCSPISVTANGLTAVSKNQFVLSFGAGPLNTKSFVQKANINPANANLDNLLLVDMDGDGRPDAVSGADSFVVQRNTSTVNAISFAKAMAYGPGGRYTIKMVDGDIDGDGKIDIIKITAFSFNSVFLSVYKNTSTPGSISFTRFDFPSNIDATNLIVTDLDNDGKLDVVTNGAGNSNYATWVYRNTSINGNISFAARQTFSFGVSDYNICATDLDGDGKTDLVNTSRTGSNLLLTRNTSSPGLISFASTVNIVVGGYPSYSYTADMDADGKQDIIVRNDNGGVFSIFKNESTPGNFSFTSRTNYPGDQYANKYAIGDVDGDGKPDIAGVSAKNNNTVSIYRNTSSPGNISLASFVSVNTQFNMDDIELCDLDGDGKTDIGLVSGSFIVLRNVIQEPVVFSVNPVKAAVSSTVTINGYSFTETTSVKFNNVPAASFSILSDTVITAVLPAALAGNVAVTNAAGTGSLDGIFPIPKIISFRPNYATTGDTVTIRGNEFNPVANDNVVYFGAVKAPVLLATDTMLLVKVPAGALYDRISVSTHNLTAYSVDYFNLIFTSGDTAFTASSFDTTLNIYTGYSPQRLAIRDLDGDGRSDIAISDFYFATTLKNTTSNSLLSFDLKYDSTTQYKSTFGDIDGDGKLDRVVSQGGPPQLPIGTYQNQSTINNIVFGRGVYMANTAPFSSSYYYFYPAIDDMNMDGKPDVITGNNDGSSTSGSLLVLKNTTADSIISFIRKPGYYTSGGDGQLFTADIDGDSLPDVVSIYTRLSAFSVILNSSQAGNITFGTNRLFYTTEIAAYFVVGDVDGDGKKDIIVVNSQGNSFSIFRNTSVPGAVSFAPKIDYSTGGNDYGFGLAMGDLNGDGKPDIAVTNSKDSTISLYMNKSLPGNISMADSVNYNIGNAPQFVVIGDVNMDGYPDIAAASPASSVISILTNRQGKPIEKTSCNPVGNITLNAGEAANSFQWQLSTDGIHYSNISDNTYYAGTATNTLVLTNAPTSWYGYQYRCLADGRIGRVNVLKFADYWIGLTNNDWFTASNWACGVIPDSYTDVFINNGVVVLNANTAIRTLTIKNGASLNIINGAILNITH